MAKSLAGSGNRLAIVGEQRHLLRPTASTPPFAATLQAAGHGALAAPRIDVLQINVGRLCNQTCRHCHVDAGPDRTEVMTLETMQACLDVLRDNRIPTVDVTGGAPEMNPHFRWLVEKASALRCKVIDRCNLTILVAPRYEDLPAFLARHRVAIVASLPYYSASSTDRQRGDGVFEKSIEALRRLNNAGYGLGNPDLPLTLVYNPVGAFLPPDQSETEALFRRQLRERHGVEFTNLFTIANQPINRFLDYLVESGNFEAYMERLVQAFNPAAVDGLMCRFTLSVGWDGILHDCDFNQMLALGLSAGRPKTIFDFDLAALINRPVVVGQHCYACTAGQGSSCGGATV